MANTLYASFVDAALAEKAAGALLDHGVRAEDLSLIQNERYSSGNTMVEHREGEMTGATTDSPGVMGTGTYTANSETYTESGYSGADADTLDRPTMSNTGPYGTTAETGYVDAYDTDATDRGEGMYRESKDDDDDDDENRDPASFEKSAKHGISTTTGADAGSGAVKGGAIGLGVGAIAAIASLLVPGIGLITGAGALATAIGGLVATTAGGAAVGAVTGYLKDQGVEEHVAQQYGEAVEKGGAILAIHVPSGDVDEPKARQLLEKYGASNVNTYAMADSNSPYMA